MKFLKEKFYEITIIIMAIALACVSVAVTAEKFSEQNRRMESVAEELEREKKINDMLIWQLENIEPSKDR